MAVNSPVIAEWASHFFAAAAEITAVAALGVAAGFYYRICITIFFLGFTYVELIDQTAYLNHYYLISLLSGLMIFLPANRAWSIDVLRRPGLRLDVVPAWTLNILRFQIGVVFVFAGLAKLNADWLLSAQPLRIWLAARSDLPLLGPLLDNAGIAYAASWFVAVYDLSIVPFLLHPRTRGPAYLAVIVFHVATLALFNIGMFPWIMIVATLLFFLQAGPDAACRISRTWFPPVPDGFDSPTASRPWSEATIHAALLALCCPGSR